MNWIGYRWYCVKLWFRERPHKLTIWLAWKLPRKRALWAYIRVVTADSWNRDPNMEEYRLIYDAWERGAGK
jgi:hypothetical protein